MSGVARSKFMTLAVHDPLFFCNNPGENNIIFFMEFFLMFHIQILYSYLLVYITLAIRYYGI